MKFIRRAGVILLGVCILFACAGCGQTNKEETGGTYNMNSALDAAQYCSFLNKQIDAVTNQLSAVMVTARTVVNGSYPASDAIKSAEASIGIIKVSSEGVENMIPPEQYKDSRENVLRLMQAAKEDIQAYIDALSQDDVNTSAVDALISVMQGDFASLTAEFNIYYE